MISDTLASPGIPSSESQHAPASRDGGSPIPLSGSVLAELNHNLCVMSTPGLPARCVKDRSEQTCAPEPPERFARTVTEPIIKSWPIPNWWCVPSSRKVAQYRERLSDSRDLAAVYELNRLAAELTRLRYAGLGITTHTPF